MTRGYGRTLAVAVLAVAVGGTAFAADPADTKALDKSIVASLRDVHDRGADLYNLSKDYTGTYRMYEGALLAVRPLLAHRPEVQKAIDDGVAAAGKEVDVARRAFLLHETIEKVRADLKGTTVTPKAKVPEPKKPVETTKPPEPKKPEVKKPEVKKPVEPKKPEPKKPVEPTTPAPKPKDKTTEPAAGGATVSGRVTFKGQPLDDGTVTFVSLDKKAPKVVTAKIADGEYTAKDVPAGKYAVSVTGGKTKLPEKFATTDSSGLTAEVKAGKNSLNFDLK